MPGSYHAGDEAVPGFRLIERLPMGCFGEAWKAVGGDGSSVVIRSFPLHPEQVAQRVAIFDELPQITHPSLVKPRECWVRDKQGILHNEWAAAGQAPSRTSGGTVVVEPELSPVVDAIEGLLIFDAPTRGILDRWHECQQQGLPGIPSEELLGYFAQLAGGIDLLQATDAGPHGFVDPRNIFLWSSQARLCDWGIRSLLPEGAGLDQGPTLYMPPERLNSGIVRGRADQYGLAICYAKLRSNRMTIDTLDDGAVLDLTGLTASERQVIQRATALAPADRYESCDEFVKALRAAGGGETVTAKGVRTVVISQQQDSAQAIPDSPPPSQPAAQTVMTKPDETPETADVPDPEAENQSEPESPSPQEPTPSANTVRIRPEDTDLAKQKRDEKKGAPPTVYMGPGHAEDEPSGQAQSGQPTVAIRPGARPSKPGEAPPTVHGKVESGAATVRYPSPTVREDVGASSGTVADVRELVPPADDDDDVDGEFMGSAPQQSSESEGLIGDYLLIEKLGEGGSGAVYRAMHRHMERIVAVKVLAKKTMSDPGAAERFAREAEMAAKLSHENIVTAYNADRDGKRHYLVMEYVDGRNLFEIVCDDGPLSASDAIKHLIQAARGLDYAHKQRIVHRDIKPGNLMVDDLGTVKILDMGLARFFQAADSERRSITSSGTLMGTVDFMSPEQAKSPKYADHRSDIYSLGCTLHFLLTGEPPYPTKSLVDAVVAHREQPIPSLPGVSSALQEIFERMMAKTPEERFQSMGELIDAFENALLESSEPTQARPGLSIPKAEQPAATATQPEAATQPANNTLVWKIIAGVAVLITLLLLLERFLG